MSDNYITVDGQTAKAKDIMIGVNMVNNMLSHLIERNSMNPNAVEVMYMVQHSISQVKNEIYEVLCE